METIKRNPCYNLYRLGLKGLRVRNIAPVNFMNYPDYTRRPSVMYSVVVGAHSRCTNEPMGEDLYARHVSSGGSVWDLIRRGLFAEHDQIVQNVTHQMVILSVLSYSHSCCILRLSLVACSAFGECRFPSVCVLCSLFLPPPCICGTTPLAATVCTEKHWSSQQPLQPLKQRILSRLIRRGASHQAALFPPIWFHTID